MNKKINQKGFTLIELLIVIVIIGILSGVLISVIDPVRQQNRSKNAALKAAVNKAAFAVNTTRAGLGRLPYETELELELENMIPDPAGGATCTDTDELSCLFDLSGTNLPESCGASNYYEIGDQQCYFYVVAPNTSGALFRLIAKAWKLDPGADETTEPSVNYVFDSSKGFFECPVDTDFSATDGSTGFQTDVSDATASGCVPASGETS